MQANHRVAIEVLAVASLVAGCGVTASSSPLPPDEPRSTPTAGAPASPTIETSPSAPPPATPSSSPPSTEPPEPHTGGALPSDFDGDGYVDLAVGVPYEDVGDNLNAGAVVVLRGSPTGLTAVGVRRWTQDDPGIPGESGPGEDDYYGDRFRHGPRVRRF